MSGTGERQGTTEGLVKFFFHPCTLGQKQKIHLNSFINYRFCWCLDLPRQHSLLRVGGDFSSVT